MVTFLQRALPLCAQRGRGTARAACRRIFLNGERIAAHLLASGNHQDTTVPEHMPSSHRRDADWTVERIRREATKIGPVTAALRELIPGAPTPP